MTKRIFRNMLAVAVCVFLAAAFIFMTVLYDYFSATLQNQMKSQLNLATQGLLHEGIRYFDGMDEGEYRITWIGTDGSVLYDSASDIQEMENHFKREEVKEALAEGYGESSRYSATLTEQYFYSAKRLSDGTVLRISIAQNSQIMLMFHMLQPVCLLLAIAAVLSIVLASRLSKNIVKPLNELNLDEPLENDGYEELSPLLHRIDIQQRQIRNQRNQLRQKQNEFETLTEGMAEGIVLLDGKGFIVSINPSAEDLLLPTDSVTVGKNILLLNDSPELSKLLDKAAGGCYDEKTMPLKSGIYRISATPIMEENKIHGIVLLLLDITEKEKAEEIRREFTANISHELKTPLQTISGCAELLAGGMVKAEDISDFSKKIYAEASRMIRLVDDIIGLSHLDEGAEDMKWENIDLLALSESVAQSLASEAAKTGVIIKTGGEHATLYGIPQLVESIVYNLCDNAVKYNHKNGTVHISVRKEEMSVILSVADTGIGIPAEDRERIFERFYRVDKSRSKKIGGTGLGLSIVKHAVRLHGADITVDSTPGQGTTVTVKFQRE